MKPLLKSNLSEWLIIIILVVIGLSIWMGVDWHPQ